MRARALQRRGWISRHCGVFSQVDVPMVRQSKLLIGLGERSVGELFRCRIAGWCGEGDGEYRVGGRAVCR